PPTAHADRAAAPTRPQAPPARASQATAGEGTHSSSPAIGSISGAARANLGSKIGSSANARLTFAPNGARSPSPGRQAERRDVRRVRGVQIVHGVGGCWTGWTVRDAVDVVTGVATERPGLRGLLGAG